jgi:uncharacterized membrane protein
VDSAVVWFASAFGGTLTQAAYGDPCTVLVGASGTVFGSFGFFFADTIAFWHRTKRPYARILFVMFIVATYASQLQDKSLSHLAHFGGFWVGFVVGLVLRRRRPGAQVLTYIHTGVCALFFVWTVVSVVLTIRNHQLGQNTCVHYGQDDAWFEDVTLPTCSM